METRPKTRKIDPCNWELMDAHAESGGKASTVCSWPREDFQAIGPYNTALSCERAADARARSSAPTHCYTALLSTRPPLANYPPALGDARPTKARGDGGRGAALASSCACKGGDADPGGADLASLAGPVIT